MSMSGLSLSLVPAVNRSGPSVDLLGPPATAGPADLTAADHLYQDAERALASVVGDDAAAETIASAWASLGPHVRAQMMTGGSGRHEIGAPHG